MCGAQYFMIIGFLFQPRKKRMVCDCTHYALKYRKRRNAISRGGVGHDRCAVIAAPIERINRTNYARKLYFLKNFRDIANAPHSCRMILI